MSFYVILYRIAMAEAASEVNKTRKFVAMLPVHVLTREVPARPPPRPHQPPPFLCLCFFFLWEFLIPSVPIEWHHALILWISV
jgi:hypothetical protein